ncbi:MAG: APC family permease [Ktedonobacterales bacterium]
MPATRPEESAPFRIVDQDIYEASLEVSEPDTVAEHTQRLLLGDPIPERLAARESLNKVRALALLSSDALSSVAYGTEASLAVLIVAGAAALSANLGIGLVTAALMLIVGYSYRQTIYAYPSGGGSYIVARDNLGVVPGLVAAAALLIDYVLTVSVSVASGIDAIASAIPALVPAKLAIDLGAIVLIMLINLRGLRAAGTIFAFPTYFFLTSFGLTLIVGIAQAIVHGGLTAASPPPAITATSTLTPLLILTAFSAGCSAMTGVEAISNGVPAFSGNTPERRSRNAAQTLTIMIALLVTFLLGTTYLAWRAGAVPYPSGDPTVTAQIARFAYSGAFGWLFYVVQTATLLILVFAANTSFADFPRLSAILARDNFAPVLFAYRGERVAFSVGIGALGIVSIVVLLIFRGNVVALINLYALGVFTAFTLSQSGMVVHWLHRRQEAGWQGRIVANGAGAIATGIVTLVIAFTKFDRGAWVVVILIPLMVLGFLAIHAYYHRPKHLQLTYTALPKADVAFVPILSHQPVPPSSPRQQPANGRPAVVPSSLRETPSAWNWEWPGVLSEELAYAARIAPELCIVRVVEDRREANDFCAAWNAYKQSQSATLPPTIRVEALLSPYRTIVLPLANFLEWQQQHEFAGKRVAVVLPCEEHPAWWEWPLQRGAATHLRQQLQRRHSTIQIIDLPYTLGDH